MKLMNKGIIFVILLVLIVGTMTVQPVMAKALIPEVDLPRLGIVVDVIDGDAVKVIYNNASPMESFSDNIKFVGVDTGGSDKAFNYTLNQLLGKAVYVLYADVPDVGRYKQAYVYLTQDQSMSESLVERGLAVVDSESAEGNFYDELKTLEGRARRQEIGRWELSTTTSDIVNINLASKDFLMTYLDITEEQADIIIGYRIHNPINDGLELGFLNPALGREFLIDTRSRFHVTTAIESAGQVELASLFSHSDSAFEMAASVMRYRLFNRLNSDADLLNIPEIDRNEKRVKPYISLAYNGDILIDDVDKVNLNTVSRAHLKSVLSLKESRIDNFIKSREKNDYIYRSLEELSKPNYPLNGIEVLPLSDKITFVTDVNKASELELRSLTDVLKISEKDQKALVNKMIKERPYSNFKKLEVSIGASNYKLLLPYLSIGTMTSSDKAIINLNTSPINKIRTIIEMSDSDARYVERYQGDIVYPGKVRIKALDQQTSYSLYTNINTANYETLMALSPKMTRSLALAIIDERSYYPFYNEDEFKDFLFDRKAYGLYNDIRAFTVYY